MHRTNDEVDFGFGLKWVVRELARLKCREKALELCISVLKNQRHIELQEEELRDGVVWELLMLSMKTVLREALELKER